MLTPSSYFRRHPDDRCDSAYELCKYLGTDLADPWQSPLLINIWLLTNASKLTNPRLLDLGCGVDHMCDRSYVENRCTPRFCDHAYNSGWNVLGVDKVNMRRQPKWDFMLGDIRIMDQKVFNGRRFDWVNSTKLITLRNPWEISPGLVLSSGIKPYEVFKSLDDLYDPEYIKIVRRVFTLVSAVLEDGGIFTLNNADAFLKIDGRLEPISRGPGAFLRI